MLRLCSRAYIKIVEAIGPMVGPIAESVEQPLLDAYYACQNRQKEAAISAFQLVLKRLQGLELTLKEKIYRSQTSSFYSDKRRAPPTAMAVQGVGQPDPHNILSGLPWIKAFHDDIGHLSNIYDDMGWRAAKAMVDVLLPMAETFWSWLRTVQVS